MAVSFFGTIAVTVRSIASVWGKRLETGRGASSADAVERRLAHIETAVDVIALEVERIAESQRFAIRLAAERDAGRIASPQPHASEGRTITPH